MSWNIASTGKGSNLSYSQAGTPSLDLRFAETKTLRDFVSGRDLVTFTRSSPATYVDSAGVLRTAGTNEPRFDHNPTTGECLGLLVEEQRTNLLVRSEEFDNATWVQINVGNAANTQIAPNGNTTADTLSITVANSNLFRQDVTVAASTTYTFSFYVKRGTATDLTYSVYDFSGSADIVAPTSYYGSTSATEWRRISLTFTTPAGCTSIGVYPVRSNPSTGTVFIWGAQLEAGAFPTSYIPTTGSAATRNADVVSITGANFSSWYRQDEGTMFVHHQTPSTPTNNFAAQVSDNSYANRIVVGQESSIILSQVIVGSSITLQPTSSPARSNGVVRQVFGYAANSAQQAVNGALAVQDTSGAMTTSLTRLDLGSDQGGFNRHNGHIRRLTYWPARLPNATLQTLTQ